MIPVPLPPSCSLRNENILRNDIRLTATALLLERHWYEDLRHDNARRFLCEAHFRGELGAQEV
jgi:hypothetical protein